MKEESSRLLVADSPWRAAADLVLAKFDSVKFAMLAAVIVLASSPKAFPKDAKSVANLSGDYSRVPNEWDMSFHLSVQQRGAQVELSFTGTLRGGKGRPIEGSGTGSVSAAGVLTFSFQDPFGNSGQGRSRRAAGNFFSRSSRARSKSPD